MSPHALTFTKTTFLRISREILTPTYSHTDQFHTQFHHTNYHA